MTTIFALYNDEPLPELDCPLPVVQHREDGNMASGRLAIYGDEPTARDQLESYHENGGHHISIAELEVKSWRFAPETASHSSKSDAIRVETLGEVDDQEVWVNLYDDDDVLIQTDNFGPGVVFEPHNLDRFVEMNHTDIPESKWLSLGVDSHEKPIRVSRDGESLTFVRGDSETAEPVTLSPDMKEKFEAFLEEIEHIYRGAAE